MKGISFVVEIVSDDVFASEHDDLICVLRRPDGQPLDFSHSIKLLPTMIDNVLKNLKSPVKDVD